MRPWLVLSAVVLLVGGGVILFSGIIRGPAPREADRKDAHLERIERLEAELAANREQLRAIARQGALLGMAAASAAHREQREPPQEVKSELTPEETPVQTEPHVEVYPEAREKAFFSAYFSELDSAMKGQPRDPALSMQVRDAVQATIGATRQAEVVDVNCTVRICRLEARYQHDTRAARDRFLGELRHKLSPVLDQATIHLPTDDKRLVAYFSKQGTRLPRPTTSFDAFMRGDEG